MSFFVLMLKTYKLIDSLHLLCREHMQSPSNYLFFIKSVFFFFILDALILPLQTTLVHHCHLS